MDVTTKLGRAEQRVAVFDLRRVAESPFMDVAVGGLLFLLAFPQIERHRWFPLLGFVLLATAPHGLRRRHPWAAVSLTFLGALGLLLYGRVLPYEAPAAVYLSGALSLYTILRQLNRLTAWLLSGAIALVFLLFAAWPNRDHLADVIHGQNRADFWITLALAIAAVTFLTDVRRSRTEVRKARADTLETLREQAAMAERARIAREMHDIVAHSVSMIAIQAETAPYTLGDLDDRVKQEFAGIAASARGTLTEMRRLLGVLRADVVTTPETAPQPGLARLPELVERHDGEADLDVVGEPVPVPQAVDVSAYRIVQEALTNARVHAPGARVSIELTYRPAMLVLRIADNGPGPSGAPSDGHGLVGMRERALALGGWFEAGPGPAGGFLIQAGLPLE
ncbi:sensor histidine kinase [Streptosporangium sp. CA-135522]|uniref:sensor histidine kinase n=1 Tax=Streptosporangium sp. CA-135522 TaxID=3240072 RepID=UPI003D8E909B